MLFENRVHVLSSLGFVVTSAMATFDQAMAFLKGSFDSEENIC